MSHYSETQPTIDRIETGKDRKRGVSLKRKAAALALTLVTAAGVAGCGTSGGTAEAKPTTSTSAEAKVPSTAPVGAETIKPADSSASEKAYAAYLETLTPAQQAVRESLKPDSLAKMSDAEVTDVFTIKASEVTDGKGKINIKDYEEAFAARSGAILMAGCSTQEYDEVVRTTVNIPKDAAQHALAVKYNELASPAFYGHKSGDLKANEDVILRSEMIQDLRHNGVKPFPNPYLAEVTLTDKPADAYVHPDGTVDLKITTRLRDNYDTALMSIAIGIDTPTTDRLDVNTITGLHIDADGAVVPGTIVLN